MNHTTSMLLILTFKNAEIRHNRNFYYDDKQKLIKIFLMPFQAASLVKCIYLYDYIYMSIIILHSENLNEYR